MKNSNCACKGNTLPKLVKPAIMKAISMRPMYGYEILKELTDNKIFGSGSADLGGIYRALKNLEKEGKLSSELKKSETGPARRIYKLTPKGHTCLSSWEFTLWNYLDQIENTLKFLKS